MAGGGLGGGWGAGGLGHRRPSKQVPQQVLGVGSGGLRRWTRGLHCLSIQAQEVHVFGRGRSHSCRRSIRLFGGCSLRPAGPLVAGVALLAGQRQHLVIGGLALLMGTLPTVWTTRMTWVWGNVINDTGLVQGPIKIIQVNSDLKGPSEHPSGMSP